MVPVAYHYTRDELLSAWRSCGSSWNQTELKLGIPHSSMCSLRKRLHIIEKNRFNGISYKAALPKDKHDDMAEFLRTLLRAHTAAKRCGAGLDMTGFINAYRDYVRRPD